ncbi:hypothetical protein ILYODFUR_032888 [Ilyodon furcidens]|uniref:Uncharacterized protein n=1 Tax=Ilyodon furcidens TaxID=33524 RepID=A0ABV0SSI0_9TELE
MGLGSEFIGGWDYFILWRLWLAGLFGPCRPLFCTWPPPRMRMGVVGDWGQGGGGGVRAGVTQVQARVLAVCLSPPPEGRGPPYASRGWLSQWAIGTWTWEYRVCMGSVNECTTSIVVRLYVGCVGVSVFMCTHEGGNV